MGTGWSDFPLSNVGLGAVGGYASLSDYTELGGQLTVFELPGDVAAAPAEDAAGEDASSG